MFIQKVENLLVAHEPVAARVEGDERAEIDLFREVQDALYAVTRRIKCPENRRGGARREGLWLHLTFLQGADHAQMREAARAAPAEY